MSKAYDNAKELEYISFDSTNNKINFSVGISTNNSPVAASVYDANTTSNGSFTLPAGNTASRPASAANGAIRFNTTIGAGEMYFEKSGWSTFVGEPLITSVSPETFNGTSGTAFEIIGVRFDQDAQIYFVAANGTSYLAGSTAFYSPTRIVATTPRTFTVAYEPLSVKIVQNSGTYTKENVIDCGGVPSWITTAGNLGTIFGANTVNVYVSATDPDGNAISYSITSGSLPSGLTLTSANGLIQGLNPGVTTNTTYNFTITATDAVNNTDRAFNYIILNRPPVWNTAATLSDITNDNVSSYVANTTVNAYDPDGGSITYTLASGSLPTGMTLVSANGALAGPVTPVDSNTTSTFTVTATDAGNLGNTRTFTLTVQSPLPDDNFANTTLLLHADADTVIKDASTSNFPITVIADSRASNFNPYNTSWSAYFNGTSGITTAANPGMGVASGGDVTIELWMNTLTTATNEGLSDSYNSLFGTTDEAAWNSTSYGFIYSTSGISLYNGNGGGALWSIATGTLHDGVWHHIAIVRNSGTWQVFVDGVSKGTTTTQGTRTLGNDTYRYGVGTVAPGGASGSFLGYISNFRFTKSAVYTSNFTPSTTPLTPITNTALLTLKSNRFLDNSNNATLFTKSGFPEIVGFSPFAETDTSNGSMYFDGTGDYLTIPNNTAFSYNSTFSAELWYYSTHTSCTDVIPFSGNGNWDFIIPAATTVAFRWFVPGYGDTGAHTMIPNSWNHIAVSVSGGRLSFYLNGTRKYTNDAVSFSVGGTDTSKIGYGSNSIMKGYISNVRVTRGSTPYDPTQTTITVPTSPLTAISGTTFLTLQNRKGHNNHAFIDESKNKSLITRFGDTTQGTFTPFSADPGKWSTFFTKSNTTYLELPNGSVNVGANDFSIECWLYPLDRNGASTMFGGNTNRATAGGSSITFTLTNSNGYIECTAWIGGGAVNLYSPAIPLNTWTHAVFCRTGSSMSLFVNGTRVATSTSAGGSAVNDGASTYNPAIGANGTGTADNFNGYISNFRMIIGSGVYNATSSSITVPTSPLTAVTNTRVLACQDNRFIDRSTNAYTITPSGLPSVQAFSPFTPNTAYSTANTGGSIYNVATPDGLKLLTPNPTFGVSGNYTVSLWFYPTGQTGDYNPLWILSNSSSSDNPSAGLFYNSSYNLFWLNDGAGGNGFNANQGINIVPFQWNHIVVCRSGATTRCWTNGVLRVDGWTAGSMDSSKRVLYIGTGRTNADTTPGYISGFEFLNGTALYTTNANFTPPTLPPTVVANTVALIHGTNASLIDNTSKNVLRAVGDAKISTVQSKFGGSAMHMPATNGNYFISPPNQPNYLFGTGNFTVEAWVYPTAFSNQAAGIFGYGLSGGYTDWVLELDTSGNALWVDTNSVRFYASASLSLNTWTHIAVVRTNSAITLYYNGVSVGTYSTINNISGNSTSARLNVGTGPQVPGSRQFIGYIDELRITKGVARYATTFTPATKAFPNK